MALEFRLAKPEDAAALHAVTQRAFAEYARFPNPSSVLSESVDALRHALETGGGVLAYERSELIGGARFRVDVAGASMTLGRLAVVPEARGCGAGGAIVRWLERHALHLGLSAVLSTARSQQPDNRPWYRARGYIVTGYEDVYGVPRLRTFLRKDLEEASDD